MSRRRFVSDWRGPTRNLLQENLNERWRRQAILDLPMLECELTHVGAPNADGDAPLDDIARHAGEMRPAAWNDREG